MYKCVGENRTYQPYHPTLTYPTLPYETLPHPAPARPGPARPDPTRPAPPRDIILARTGLNVADLSVRGACLPIMSIVVLQKSETSLSNVDDFCAKSYNYSRPISNDSLDTHFKFLDFIFFVTKGGVCRNLCTQ